MTATNNQPLIQALQKILTASPYKILLTAPAKNCKYTRITMTAIGNAFHAEKFTKTQAFHDNFPSDKLMDYLLEYLQWNHSAVSVADSVSADVNDSTSIPIATDATDAPDSAMSLSAKRTTASVCDAAAISDTTPVFGTAAISGIAPSSKFSQLHAWDQSGMEYTMKITKQGKILTNKHKVKNKISHAANAGIFNANTSNANISNAATPSTDNTPSTNTSNTDKPNTDTFHFKNISMTHNREKNYIISEAEGAKIPVLRDMGIFTAQGKVAANMYDKFRQINRFLEFIHDIYKNDAHKFQSHTAGTPPYQRPSEVLPAENPATPSSRNCFRDSSEILPAEKSTIAPPPDTFRAPIKIVDFGCGKSYLTFLIYHYFTKILNIEANITGLDLKQSVIENCQQAAKKYGYDGLNFQLGDIADHQSFTADLLITLHACNTATDHAIFNAIKNNTHVILSAPCCQHELNQQFKPNRLHLLSRYGVVKERTAALLTDAIRANLLTWAGYKTQLLEFVDFAHTPKNLLIRAVKSHIPKEKREKAFAEVMEITAEFNLHPTLLNLLKGIDEICPMHTKIPE